MKHTRKLKRRRKRRLKKGFKVLFMTIPIIVLFILIVMFGFKMNAVNVSSDLKQFTADEVKAYLEYKGIDNTLIFWIKNKIGKGDKLDFFEEYSVKLVSPSKVKIKAYERKLQGYITNNGMYYFFDKNGTILKISDEKIKNIPKIIGLEYNKLALFNKVGVKNANVLNSLLIVINSLEVYDYKIKKIQVNNDAETSLFIEDLKIDLGKISNLDKKLKDLNDMFQKILKYNGVLNMKHASEDGSYTLRKKADTSKK